MIHVGLEVSSSLTSNPTGIQRYMSGVISGLSEQEDVSLTRLLKLSRYKKRRVMPVSDTPYRWYGLSPCSKRENINVIHCLDTTLPAWTNCRVSDDSIAPRSYPLWVAREVLSTLAQGANE